MDKLSLLQFQKLWAGLKRPCAALLLAAAGWICFWALAGQAKQGSGELAVLAAEAAESLSSELATKQACLAAVADGGHGLGLALKACGLESAEYAQSDPFSISGEQGKKPESGFRLAKQGHGESLWELKAPAAKLGEQGGWILALARAKLPEAGDYGRAFELRVLDTGAVGAGAPAFAALMPGECKRAPAGNNSMWAFWWAADWRGYICALGDSGSAVEGQWAAPAASALGARIAAGFWISAALSIWALALLLEKRVAAGQAKENPAGLQLAVYRIGAGKAELSCMRPGAAAWGPASMEAAQKIAGGAQPLWQFKESRRGWLETGGGETFFCWVSQGGPDMELRMAPASAGEGASLEEARRALASASGEMQAMRETFALAQERMKEEMGARQRFMETMSREARMRLHTILGYSQMLARDLKGTPSSEKAAEIADSSAKIMSAVNLILDMGAMESGKLSAERADVNVRSMLNKLCAAHEKSAKSAGVELIRCIGVGEREICRTDESRVLQVLGCFLENAIRATPPGGMVSVGAQADGSKLALDILDSGKGISREKISRIFDGQPQGAEPSIKSLNLFLAKRLAELLGGKVGCESDFADGKGGSRFWIELDRGSEEEEAQEAEIAEPEALRGLRVLVAEDNEVNMEVACDILARAGMVPVRAQNGQQAVELALSNNCAAALMDMRMPVLDGPEATRAIRSKGLGLPIIAVTAGAYESDREECLSSGMDGYLAKPIDEKQLLAQLYKLCIGKRSHENVKR